MSDTSHKKRKLNEIHLNDGKHNQCVDTEIENEEMRKQRGDCEIQINQDEYHENDQSKQHQSNGFSTIQEDQMQSTQIHERYMYQNNIQEDYQFKLPYFLNNEKSCDKDDCREPHNPKKDIVLLLVGDSGVGKSSLVNCLSKKEVAQTGDEDSTTVHFKTYKSYATKIGSSEYNLTIIDSPGLNDSDGNDSEILQKLLEWAAEYEEKELEQIDAILYLENVLNFRPNLQKFIRMLGKLFNEAHSEDFLPSVIEVLTKANSIRHEEQEKVIKKCIPSLVESSPVLLWDSEYEEGFEEECEDLVQAVTRVHPVTFNFLSEFIKELENEMDEQHRESGQIKYRCFLGEDYQEFDESRKDQVKHSVWKPNFENRTRTIDHIEKESGSGLKFFNNQILTDMEQTFLDDDYYFRKDVRNVRVSLIEAKELSENKVKRKTAEIKEILNNRWVFESEIRFEAYHFGQSSVEYEVKYRIDFESEETEGFYDREESLIEYQLEKKASEMLLKKKL